MFAKQHPAAVSEEVAECPPGLMTMAVNYTPELGNDNRQVLSRTKFLAESELGVSLPHWGLRHAAKHAGKLSFQVREATLFALNRGCGEVACVAHPSSDDTEA